MKSRRRSLPVEPCRCKDKCPCHHPRKNDWKYKLEMSIVCILGLSIFPAFAVFIIWHNKHYPPAIRPIEVNGQMCEIKFKVTHHSATGAARGHDIAVCK